MDETVRRNGHKPANYIKPKWTVMVYLAGDNNLTANCITVLQQLEAVKYRRDIRVLACFDSNTPWPKGSRYLAVNGKFRKNNKHMDWEIYNDLIITENRDHKITAPDFCNDHQPKGRPMKRTDVAEGLKRFLHWAMKNYSDSDHYMLVLYGHGPVVGGKTFLSQDNPLSSLRIQDLPFILGEHFGRRKRKLDILACQNCVMNGIEVAYEVRNQVEYMIGSQGLVLAYGWPYEKLISALIENPNASPREITKMILKACARHLIDFSVMDRSSEQSVCDLNKLRGQNNNITKAIRELSGELSSALQFTPVNKMVLAGKVQRELKYPIICDAVKLARLKTQTYWGETFVDVYDFCERLLKKCNEAVVAHNRLISSLGLDGDLERRFRETDLVQRLRKIIECCRAVIRAVEEMVPYSYYIGSELQYSHGVSIYFPWTMQGEPYSFYFRRRQNEHVLVTAFQTYSRYSFVEQSGWADFLKYFYCATLRKVRRAEREFLMQGSNVPLSEGIVAEDYKVPSEVLTTEFLQKTDSNGPGVDSEVWSNIKNYPRRNYLSPADCPLEVDKDGRHRAPARPNRNFPPVSYLGWNICKFVADVIMKPGKSSSTKKQIRQKPIPGLLPMKSQPPAHGRRP